MTEAIPSLSIIIATYNRAPYLLGTLESLATQHLDPSRWEAVVVNNNSKDNTAEVFNTFAAAHPELQMTMVTETRQGLSHARNCGIRHSRAPYVAIIDDDEKVNPGFAASYIDFFERYPEAAGGGGVVVPIYECPPPRWLSPIAARPIAGALYLGDQIRPFPARKYPPGGNMGVRREALERHGLFNTELGRTGEKPMGGEEKELFARLRAAGEKIYYLPGAVIYHLIPASKLTPDYFDRVNRMGGMSERVRTRELGRGAYLRRLITEGVKWVGALVFAVGYTLRLQPLKGWFLLRMRWQISRGLIG